MAIPPRDRTSRTARGEARSAARDPERSGATAGRPPRDAFRWVVPAILGLGLVSGAVAVNAVGLGQAAPILGFFLGVFVLPVAGIIWFLRASERQDRRERAEFGRQRGRRARFSNGPYAKWLPIGIALVAAGIAYPVANEFFTVGRQRFAAIFLVVLAPLVAIVVLHDPLARALDVYLARRESARRQGRGDDR